MILDLINIIAAVMPISFFMQSVGETDFLCLFAF